MQDQAGHFSNSAIDYIAHALCGSATRWACPSHMSTVPMSQPHVAFGCAGPSCAQHNNRAKQASLLYAWAHVFRPFGQTEIENSFSIWFKFKFKFEKFISSISEL
jgi:hypothetical protein